MDRKRDNFVRSLKTAITDMQELKGSQPSGEDNTFLNRIQTGSPYDLTFTIAPLGRWEVTIDLVFYMTLKPWQPTAYVVCSPQFWVDDLSSPFNGSGNSGVNILSSIEFGGQTSHNYRVQMVNISGSSKTVYVKSYHITTIPSGILDMSASIVP